MIRSILFKILHHLLSNAQVTVFLFHSDNMQIWITAKNAIRHIIDKTQNFLILIDCNRYPCFRYSIRKHYFRFFTIGEVGSSQVRILQYFYAFFDMFHFCIDYFYIQFPYPP